MPLAEFKSSFPGAVERLLAARRRGRMAHAYLFVGDSAESLERFALAWLQACACLEPAENGDACGRCRACVEMAAGSYPGFVGVRPLSRSRTIVLDQIRPAPPERQTSQSRRNYPPDRSLIYRLSLSVDPGILRLALVHEADTMNAESQNAFLKTLEEPLPRTVIALTTSQPRRLLPTIRSRCQVVGLSSGGRLYENLRDTPLFPTLARIRPGTGLARGVTTAAALAALLQQLYSEAEARVREENEERWAVLASQDPGSEVKKELEQSAKAQIESEYRRRRQEVLDALETWFRQLLLIAAGVSETELPHPEMLKAAGVREPAALRLPWELAARNASLAEGLVRELEGSNLDERLALDSFCLEACAPAADGAGSVAPGRSGF